MATRTSPFAEPVPAGEKLVDDVNTYIFDNAKRVILQRSSDQFSAWHGTLLKAPDIFKGFEFIVKARGSLVYCVPTVPAFKFTFNDSWVSVADDLWLKHIKSNHPTSTADRSRQGQTGGCPPTLFELRRSAPTTSGASAPQQGG